MQAVRGNNENGYIAIDDLFLEQIEVSVCELLPPQAVPTTTTTSTTPMTTTLTEPDDGMYLLRNCMSL